MNAMSTREQRTLLVLALLALALFVLLGLNGWAGA
jgi:hypothetical protein